METRGPSALGTGFRAAAWFVCAATALPVVKSGTWWIRALDFPRLQISALAAGLLCYAAKDCRKLSRNDKGLCVSLGVALIAQLAQVSKYTRLYPRQVKRNPAAHVESRVSLFASNVRMKNRRTGALLDCIRNQDPDIIILLEVNPWWLDQLAPLTSQYRWRVEVPKENTYGMALYSKLPLEGEKVRYLVQSDVPSIKAAVRIRSGELFDLYAVHPRPPVRGNLEGDIELEGSTKRDAELVRVALEISASGRPSIVAGDFNDVAWSHTTRHFQRVGQLLDPRIGRGLYNTYHAKFRWLRFPLDHLFHTKEFTLTDFYRGEDVGSDHFPIYASLALTVPHNQEAPAPDKEDFKEAAEKILAAHQA